MFFLPFFKEIASVQTNSNSEDFSDEGFDPSNGLVHSKQFQPVDNQPVNGHQVTMASTGNQTPSAIRNRYDKKT